MEYSLDSLEEIKVPFKFGGKSYVLHEASEPAIIAFRSSQLKSVKIEAGKVQASFDNEQLTKAHEARLALLCACVYNGTGESAGDAVRGWPHRVINRLLSELDKISDLQTPDTAEALENRIEELQDSLAKIRSGTSEPNVKNLPSATAVTSA